MKKKRRHPWDTDYSTRPGYGQPLALDAIADKVLAYRVPARTKKAKKRARKRRQIRRESCI